MNRLQFWKFMEIQRHKIKVDKWCEGIRSHNDPGNEYIIVWIFKNGKEFREQYECSKCKSCVFWNRCGHNVKTECRDYE